MDLSHLLLVITYITYQRDIYAPTFFSEVRESGFNASKPQVYLHWQRRDTRWIISRHYSATLSRGVVTAHIAHLGAVNTQQTDVLKYELLIYIKQAVGRNM